MALTRPGFASMLTLLCLLSLPGSAFAAAKTAKAGQTESPPVLSAATLLPASVLAGPNHTVDDKVATDGYMNLYTLHTPKGDLRVESTALLYTRIRELNAAAAMDQVNKGAEIGKSVALSGVNAVKGAFNLVVHPADTFSSVGKSFSRAQAGMQDQRPKDDQGAVGEMLGYNKATRQYAKTYGVDPYSKNPILQQSLKRLAGAGFFGSITATAAIPGGAALVAFSNSTSSPSSPVDVTTPPEDLFSANRERLKTMGATTDMADLFVENPHFSPIEQTQLVLALDRMTSVSGRPICINQCILTDDDDLGRFRTRMAELYANLNSTTDKIDHFVKVGKYFAAVTAQNGLLVAFPLDYLAWTPTVADIAGAFATAAVADKVKTKKFVVSGEVSPLAAKTLKAGGWNVVQLREGLR
uniref:Uncharacterized protein n=1 Tax=Desulfovibrio sp. U5L TaxID=596152 RepID=I2Q784_9BACT